MRNNSKAMAEIDGHVIPNNPRERQVQQRELHSISMRSKADAKSTQRRSRSEDDFGSAWANFKASIAALF